MLAAIAARRPDRARRSYKLVDAGLARGSAGFDSMRVEPWFGFVPDTGDVVFVVYDPARPSQNGVWGFAKR